MSKNLEAGSHLIPRISPNDSATYAKCLIAFPAQFPANPRIGFCARMALCSPTMAPEAVCMPNCSGCSRKTKGSKTILWD
jgi:hypothetical protein